LIMSGVALAIAAVALAYSRRATIASEKMAAETRKARLAQDQPYLDIRWAALTRDKELRRAVPRMLQVKLINNGRGMAFNVRSHLRSPGWEFSTPTCGKLNVGEHYDAAFNRLDELTTPTGDATAEVVAEYEDIHGQKWESHMIVEILDETGDARAGRTFVTQVSGAANT